MKTRPGSFAFVATFGLLSTAAASGQDVQKNVVYVCNGERLVIDSCNMRDLSDTSKCMVGHPDIVLANGLMKYIYETRGDLKKLLPTCKPPTAEQVARAKAFEKKQNDLYDLRWLAVFWHQPWCGLGSSCLTRAGSFRMTRSLAQGDWVLVGNNENRTRAYSLSTGEQKAILFGSYSMLSIAAGILVVEK